MSQEQEITTDEKRVRLRSLGPPDSGLYVRAKMPDGSYDSVDIWCLSREGLLVWLEGRSIEYHQSVILALLGHEHER